MKVKNVNLEYWVFYIDFNTKKPKRFNILEDMEKDIAKHIRSSANAYNHINNRITLKEYLKKDFMYHYWSKCEMEYAVGDLFICEGKNTTIDSVREDLTKLDVWYQIEPNLDLITDYIINKMKLDY